MGAAVERVRQALEDLGYPIRGSNVRFRTRCPVHEAGPRSLTLCVSQGRVGALLHCFAECQLDEIREALGLPPDALFDFSRARAPYASPHAPRRRDSPPDPLADLKAVLNRAVDIMNLKTAQDAYRAACPMPIPSADERVALAEWGGQQDADEHYWRTRAKWAALATDEQYVRQAYRDRDAGNANPEQIMVLQTRAEDLRDAQGTAA